ncbi:MAG: GTPase Era [Deltaproteobacteria bacterium]|nr:GTPase Era [Deltaproteobacteria bacterium]MBI2230077.1 GTPase Era [Deltaproteobacteria bacterium]
MPETQDQNKEKQPLPFRSGTIAIVGRPNVGKSTLLNQILGEKVAIVSPKPQTTRNRVTGIRTTEASQMIFLDTPGIHQARSLLNRRMVDVALATLHEVDGVLWLLAAPERIGPEDERIAEMLAAVTNPVFVLLNKIDLVSKGRLLPLIQRCSEMLPGKEIVPISALKGDNLPLLLELIEKGLPEGPKLFPEGEYTDQSERFLASEIIREKVFLLTREEIPYGVAVTIDEFTEKEEKNLIVIKATVHTERDSHKGILIGKRGAMLKEIGTKAREELEALLGCKIFLELFIRVDEGWTRDPNALREMGL